MGSFSGAGVGVGAGVGAGVVGAGVVGADVVVAQPANGIRISSIARVTIKVLIVNFRFLVTKITSLFEQKFPLLSNYLLNNLFEEFEQGINNQEQW